MKSSRLSAKQAPLLAVACGVFCLWLCPLSHLHGDPGTVMLSLQRNPCSLSRATAPMKPFFQQFSHEELFR